MSALAKRPGTALAAQGAEVREHLAAGEASYRAAGLVLIEVKASLPHGEFGAWLKREEIAASTARRAMQVANDPAAAKRIRAAHAAAQRKHVAKQNAISDSVLPPASQRDLDLWQSVLNALMRGDQPPVEDYALVQPAFDRLLARRA